MKAKHLALTVIYLFISFSSAKTAAQEYLWDVGVKSGMANYFGDLEQDPGTNSFNLFRPNTRWAGGLFARKRLNYRFAIRFDLSYARISGADSLNPESDRTSRNLHFRNDVLEGSGRFEFYPIVIDDVGWKRRFIVDFHLMGFMGAGVYYHEPKAEYKGNWEQLRPLKTEGTSYSPVHVSVPMGIGGFFTFATGNDRIRRHRLGIEISYRMLFTDYLDDVSSSYPEPDQVEGETARDLYYRTWELNEGQSNPDTRRYPGAGRIRGNPEDNDGFGTITVSYSYILETKRNGKYRPKYNYIYGNSIRNKRKRGW